MPTCDALLGELGMLGANAEAGQPVENAEFLLAQALVEHALQFGRVTGAQRDQQAVSGLARP